MPVEVSRYCSAFVTGEDSARKRYYYSAHYPRRDPMEAQRAGERPNFFAKRKQVEAWYQDEAGMGQKNGLAWEGRQRSFLIAVPPTVPATNGSCKPAH